MRASAPQRVRREIRVQPRDFVAVLHEQIVQYGRVLNTKEDSIYIRWLAGCEYQLHWDTDIDNDCQWVERSAIIGVVNLVPVGWKLCHSEPQLATLPPAAVPGIKGSVHPGDLVAGVHGQARCYGQVFREKASDRLVIRWLQLWEADAIWQLPPRHDRTVLIRAKILRVADMKPCLWKLSKDQLLPVLRRLARRASGQAIEDDENSDGEDYAI